MLETAAIIVVLAMALVLYRAIKGPRLYDRALAVNVIGTKTVVLLALIGFIYDRPYFLDIALVYALINFIATIAILKYRETGGLG
ncbi:MAG: monovalent cation/H+ antiporter complex subunit F [Smithellaceae bacterium]|nr:monovalent cation/H+ antiporter complex subunit F [Smithellaceae bacterium]